MMTMTMNRRETFSSATSSDRYAERCPSLGHDFPSTPSVATSQRSSASSPSSTSSTSSTSSRSSSSSSSSSSRSGTTSTRSSSPLTTSLLSAVAISMTLLLVFSSLEMASAKSGVLLPALSKRSFLEISCKGVYDKSIYARLDRICEDCYNLFREPQLHSLCRKDCFTSDYFKGCIDVLLLHDEIEQIQTWIKQLHGADPLV